MAAWKISKVLDRVQQPPHLPHARALSHTRTHTHTHTYIHTESEFVLHLNAGTYDHALHHFQTATQLAPYRLIHRVEVGRVLAKASAPPPPPPPPPPPHTHTHVLLAD